MDNIIQALQYWGIEDAAINPTEQASETTWDINDKYILKEFRSFEDLSNSTKFSKLLTSYNIPVVKFIPTKNGEFNPPDSLLCLMTKLSGKHINFYENPGLANKLGRELALLHIALLNIEKEVLFHDNNLLDDWQTRIKPSLDDVSKDMVNNIDEKLRGIFPKLLRQLIHRDVHPENVLFEGEQLCGWLDFDLSHKNIRLFDIAYFLAGLLVNNINNSEKIKVWNEIRRNLIEGYNKETQLTKDEINALPVIMIVIEFLFAWFWSTQGNTKERTVALEIAMWLYHEKYNDILSD